jgi:hypothetical protein
MLDRVGVCLKLLLPASDLAAGSRCCAAARKKTMKQPNYPHSSLKVVEPYKQALATHQMYSAISSLDHVRTFMETHVFAVWDFMCLLKALQRALTCTETPWIPRGDAATRRLINEIVLSEESDLLSDGTYASHFELYLTAMEEAGAETLSIRTFIQKLEAGEFVQVALEDAKAPAGARQFVLNTMDIMQTVKPHAIAAAFAIGREDIIPRMFLELIKRLGGGASPYVDGASLSLFLYYLERHVELDGAEHSILAAKMMRNLCAADEAKWRESADVAVNALQARAWLWDSVTELIDAEVTEGPAVTIVHLMA